MHQYAGSQIAPGGVARLYEGMNQLYAKVTTTIDTLMARVDSDETMMQALQVEIAQLHEDCQSSKAAGNKKGTTKNGSNEHPKLKVSHVCVH